MSHSAEKDARQLLAQADRAKEVARWAEAMRGAIRLGRPVKVSEMHQRGPFGRRRKYLYELDDRMPRPAVDALYRALAMVRDEAEAEAYVAEHMVTTAPLPPAVGESGGA